jgi:tRNA dimethylallyltransferase
MLFQNKIKKFLEKKWDKQKIIVIYWPTASWKTALSIDVAKKLDTEIISTDSRQIFKEMNIWTAKITKEEMGWVKHHMIDIIEPNREYSVWEFKKQAEEIISDLIWKWKIPILAWWTWLYIDSLIYDFEIPKVPADWELRKKLEQEAKEFWNEFLYKKLLELDLEYAKTLHPNNVQYVIRALEIKILTWKSKSDFIQEKIPKYDILFLTPYDWNREKLYERINKRVDLMFEQGLLEEVKILLKKYKKTDFWLKTIWYAEIIDYLDWEISLDEAKDKIKQNSRNYAKRQLTWFRKYEK